MESDLTECKNKTVMKEKNLEQIHTVLALDFDLPDAIRE